MELGMHHFGNRRRKLNYYWLLHLSTRFCTAFDSGPKKMKGTSVIDFASDS